MSRSVTYRYFDVLSCFLGLYWGLFDSTGIVGQRDTALSMIKLTPHRVSRVRFCALNTAAAAIFNNV